MFFLYRYAVRYNELQPQIARYMCRLDPTYNLTIHIRIDTMIDTCYQPMKHNDMLEAANTAPGLLSSVILNIAAHYRHFFRSRYNRDAIIFLYYTFEPPSQILIPEYKARYYMKRNRSITYTGITSYIKSNLNMIALLTSYIPGVYLINTADIEPALVQYSNIMSNQLCQRGLNLIVSRDIIDHNIFAAVRNERLVLLIEPRIRQLFDESNIMDITFGAIKRHKVNYPIEPTYRLLPMMYSIIGYPRFGIRGVYGYGPQRTHQLFCELLSSGVLQPDSFYDTIELILDRLPERTHTNVRYAFELFSLRLLSEQLSMNIRNQLYRQIVDRYAPLDLTEINNRYYNRYPIRFDYLL